MANQPLKVTSGELTKKAHAIQNPRPQGPGPAKAPDLLPVTCAAMEQLVASAEAVNASLAAGDVEAQRLAGRLNAAAKAYDAVDAERAAALKAQMNGSQSVPPVNPVTPDLTGIPDPPTVPSFGYPPAGSWDIFTEWESATRTIYAGDTQALSVKYFRDQWKAYKQSLQDHAGNFARSPEGWDGPAAEACENCMRKHYEWLHKIADNCHDLGQQAETLADAHDKLVADHPTMDDLEKYQSTSWSNPVEKMARYAYFQTKSEEALRAYAHGVNLTQVKPENPPSCGGGLPPVKPDDVPEPAPGTQPPGQPGAPGGGAPGGGAPGGGAPGGGAPAAPAMPSTPQMPATPQPAAAKTGSPGGMPGGMPGGSQGGKQGGGMPGGLPGGMPGGMPAAAKATPHLPNTPPIKPASTGGGGGAGAGGGGGAPKMPLQPAVASSAVGPSHADTTHGAAPAKAAGGGGAMGGGMGGMPMGAHGGQGQGKEKRRSPGLSPDEELYKEDRAWTEGVIGARGRKNAPDAKDSKDSK